MTRIVLCDGVLGKPCTKCKSWQPLTNYSAKKDTSDNLNCWCKACCSANAKSWAQANREQYLNSGRERQKTLTPEQRESERQRSLKYRTEQPDKRRAVLRGYYERNRDRENQRVLAYAKANPEHRRLARLKRRALKAGNGGSHTQAEWESLKAKYDYTCLRCGRKEPDIRLTADHVIPVSKSGGHSNISNIQPLCLSCNASKQDKTIDYRSLEDHHA